jgi:hypothetical protein
MSGAYSLRNRGTSSSRARTELMFQVAIRSRFFEGVYFFVIAVA